MWPLLDKKEIELQQIISSIEYNYLGDDLMEE